VQKLTFSFGNTVIF